MGLITRRQRIAVVEMFGTLGTTIRSAVYERVLSGVRKDPRVKALVLDIDSPGGSVTASDYMYRSVVRVAEEKPVVASIRGLGASGGYLVACAAGTIVAIPGALVGSVGVISIRPVLEGLLERLGVAVSVNKSGKLKDMGAFWRAATDEEQQKMQALTDDYYEDFVATVSRERGMDLEAVRALATGEVYRAPRAKELGLVDELGDLDRAVDLAAELSGAPRRPVRVGPRRGLRERLMGPFADALVETTAAEIERRIWSGYLSY